MARTRTLTNLIADCRQRANMENSTFVTDAEITEILNQELAELWERLVGNAGQPFYRSQTSISVVSGTALYSLPADFWQVQEVTATISGVTHMITPFMPSEHGWLTTAGAWGPYAPVQYRIQSNNIEFVPATQNFTVTLYYSPCQPRLVNAGDTFDGFNGWEVAALAGTVAVMLAKEESDMASFWENRKAQAYVRIDKASAARDAFMPERVQDVETGQMWPGMLLGWWS